MMQAFKSGKQDQPHKNYKDHKTWGKLPPILILCGKYWRPILPAILFFQVLVLEIITML